MAEPGEVVGLVRISDPDNMAQGGPVQSHTCSVFDPDGFFTFNPEIMAIEVCIYLHTTKNKYR